MDILLERQPSVVVFFPAGAPSALDSELAHGSIDRVVMLIIVFWHPRSSLGTQHRQLLGVEVQGDHNLVDPRGIQQSACVRGLNWNIQADSRVVDTTSQLLFVNTLVVTNLLIILSGEQMPADVTGGDVCYTESALDLQNLPLRGGRQDPADARPLGTVVCMGTDEMARSIDNEKLGKRETEFSELLFTKVNIQGQFWTSFLPTTLFLGRTR
jgi:hypothetical protein